MTISRRKLLKMAGLTAGSLALPVGGINLAFGASATQNKLVVIYLRFGSDTMYMVAPTANAFTEEERDFYLRTDATTANFKDGLGREEFFDSSDFSFRNMVNSGGVISYTSDANATLPGLPLTNAAGNTHSDYMLHPAMSAFADLYSQNRLAIVHGVGGQNSHSHFAAQDATEWALPDRTVHGTDEGWLHSIVANTTAAISTPFNGISMTPALSESFAGTPLGSRLSAINSIGAFSPNSEALALGEDSYKGLLAKLYPNVPAGSLGEFIDLKNQGHELLSALAISEGFNYVHDDNNWDDLSNNRIDGFMQDLRDAVTIIKSSEAGVCCVNIDASLGWDTHQNQVEDQFRSIDRLNKGLAGFIAELGTDLDDTTVLLQSEFGRTFDVNGNNGTDHGEGGVYFVINSGSTFTKGGQVIHEPWTWPTSFDTNNGWSHPAGRYYTPDETDFRQIYAEIMKDFMGMDIPTLEAFFAETYDSSLGRFQFKRSDGVTVRPGFPGLFI